MNWKVQQLVYKAYDEIEKGAYEKAIHHLQKAILRDAENPELYAYLGEAHYHQRDFKNAEEAFAKRDELLLKQNSLTPYIEGYRGCISLENNDREKAQILLEKAVQQNVEDPEIHYKLGILYYQQGKMSEALAVLAKLDKFDPSFYYRKIQSLVKEIKSHNTLSNFP